MKVNKFIKNYWFTIEPYVYIGITEEKVLLFNTLDKEYIESDQKEVIELLQKNLRKENLGVCLLSSEDLKNECLNTFILELRNKYMGDIIDTSLSNRKPIQIYPYFNLLGVEKYDIYYRHNFYIDRSFLNYLSEIHLFIDEFTNIKRLTSILQSLPDTFSYKITGDLRIINYNNYFLSFCSSLHSSKTIQCYYKDFVVYPINENDFFSYEIIVDFPLEENFLKKSIQLKYAKKYSVGFIFHVKSLEDCIQCERIVEVYQIDNYILKPIYNKTNIDFLKENIFLSKQDILSTDMSIKEIFANQIINTYDFGKIKIKSNGDVYANLNHDKLGNIYENSINELIKKEIFEGKSWLRIRNQPPCSNCVFQWLCPSPSDLEIAIGYPNLCEFNNEI